MNKINESQRQAGFTLVELIVAAVILAILLLVAVPGYQTLIRNQRVVSLTNSLVSSLNLARSEAIMRGVSVSVCPAADQTFSACGNDWSQGWLIFVNPDNNSTFENNATEQLLRVKQITHNNAVVQTNNNANLVTYNSTGFADQATGNISFSLNNYGAKTTEGRIVSISRTGQIVSKKATA